MRISTYEQESVRLPRLPSSLLTWCNATYTDLTSCRYEWERRLALLRFSGFLTNNDFGTPAIGTHNPRYVSAVVTSILDFKLLSSCLSVSHLFAIPLCLINYHYWFLLFLFRCGEYPRIIWNVGYTCLHVLIKSQKV